VQPSEVGGLSAHYEVIRVSFEIVKKEKKKEYLADRVVVCQ
jgi:hypothetical protein